MPYEKQDKIKHWLDKNEPAFTSEERIQEAEQYGIQIAELEAGDFLYFPSHWYHEVHNLSSQSKAITNSVQWPQTQQDQEEIKDG